MQLSRKTFLKSLAALAAGPFFSPGGARTLAVVPPAPTIPLPPEPELWLKEWLQAPRLPILESADLKERFFIRALRLNRPVGFAYLGGSQAGSVRHVHPVLLYHVQGYPSAYLTGYCETRQEVRTFRLDRVQLHPQG